MLSTRRGSRFQTPGVAVLVDSQLLYSLLSPYISVRAVRARS